MNISNLKTIVLNLPDEISSVQFGAIEVEFEDLLAQQRLADEAELQAIQEREKALRVKLGLNAPVRAAPPPVRPPPRKPSAELMELQASDEADFGAETDAGGRNTGEVSFGEGNNAFLADLAACRQRGMEKRRRSGH